jgi:hypothetical protein
VFSSKRRRSIAIREVVKGDEVKVQYGIATYDRWNGRVSSEELQMDGVQDGGFIEFFESAGENGWELCGSFSSGVTGSKVAQANTLKPHTTTEPSEYITFIFKRV